MHRTCETRWFLVPDDAAVAPLERLFADVTPEPPSVDAYLRAASADVGVKVRGHGGSAPRLEIKVRHGALGPLAIADGVTGHVELWAKAAATEGSALEGEDLALVAKERRLRRYVVQGGAVLERAAAGDEVSSQIELTRVRRGDATWITLGAETHGAEPDLVASHLAVMRHALEIAGPLVLRAEDALGYPAWLLRAG